MKLLKISTSSKEDLRKKGIYKIYLVDGKSVYIGSSFHKDGINRRLNEHFRLLHKNKHHSKKLQNYYNKYGMGSLKVCLLEEIKDKNFLIEREQFWIDYFKSENFNIFNCSLIAKIGRTDIDFSFRHKKIYQFSLEGVLIKSYNSVKEAELEFNCSKGIISLAVIDYPRTYKGFIWQDSPNFKPLIFKENKTNSKSVICVEDGKIYKSISKAAKYYNLDISTISKILRGKHKGRKFNFKYYEYNTTID